ncbi:MAG: DUF4065 domain-containing protein [Saprospiraceae bacterium]|nr:DUF4065 domain-containing protein [Saprospiraceae bacterium]
MFTARQIAEYVLTLSNPEIGELTSNLKLQKLLYYVQGVHLAAFDSSLFEEEIVAWNYGPVVESVYQDFKVFNSGAIFIPYSKEKDVLTKDKKDFIDSVYS